MKIRIVYLQIIIFFILISCENSGGKYSESINAELTQIDSLKEEIHLAIGTLNAFPMEEVLKKLTIVSDYHEFFMNSPYVFEKAVYMNELDKMAATKSAFEKVSGAMGGIQADAQIAISQLSSLKLAFEQKQISEEELVTYLADEIQAIEILIFNYNRRVLRAMELFEGLDTLLPALEDLKLEALEGAN
jgi:hypothetical protein